MFDEISEIRKTRKKYNQRCFAAESARFANLKISKPMP